MMFGAELRSRAEAVEWGLNDPQSQGGAVALVAVSRHNLHVAL